jgi:hypothetical protein
MKTTVEIADPLFERAKRESETSGSTLRDLIELGLYRILQEREELKKKPFVLRDCSVKGELNPAMRVDDGRAMRLYAYMGRPGMPDTIEGVNQMLDERDAADAIAAAAAARVAAAPEPSPDHGKPDTEGKP